MNSRFDFSLTLTRQTIGRFQKFDWTRDRRDSRSRLARAGVPRLGRATVAVVAYLEVILMPRSRPDKERFSDGVQILRENAE